MTSTSAEEKNSTRRPASRTPASKSSGLALRVLPYPFAICRLDPEADIPEWAERGAFSSISRNAEELSIICEERHLPRRGDRPAGQVARGWSAIQVIEPLGDPIIGVLSLLAHTLTDHDISLFAVSTFESDYVFIRSKKLAAAVEALEDVGHRFRDARPLESWRLEKPPAKQQPSPRPEKRNEKEPGDEERDEKERTEKERAAKERAAKDQAATERAAKERVAEDQAATEQAGEHSVSVSVPLSATTEVRSVKARRNRTRRPPAANLDAKARPATPVPQEERDEAAASPRARATDRSERPSDRDERRPGPKDRRDDSDDEGAEATGLFTGAIPQSEVATTETGFDTLGLSQPVLETIEAVGFKHPTPIQASVVPEALKGHDIIGLAETGSGKTAAFVLPMVERLGLNPGGTRGLILCPTREIALQTKAFLDVFSKRHDLESLTIIGGVRMGPQIQGLKRGADILVATPGRLADHLRRRNARLDKLEQLVLDEADHMLDLGFLPQIQEILEQVPEERQTMMFSATMPTPIARLTRRFMRDPVRIDFRPEGHMAEGIEHRLYLLQNPDDKKRCLLKLLEEIDGSTLVFTRRRLDAEWLSRQLEQEGIQVERIHSDRSQAHRVRALRAFREGHHRVLVATDVAARGIDIPRIEHVINFELPDQVEDYVHRAGRTARGDAVGIVSSICSWQDKPMVKDIEQDLGIQMPRHKIEGIQAFAEVKRRKNVRRRRLL